MEHKSLDIADKQASQPNAVSWMASGSLPPEQMSSTKCGNHIAIPMRNTYPIDAAKRVFIGSLDVLELILMPHSAFVLWICSWKKWQGTIKKRQDQLCTDPCSPQMERSWEFIRKNWETKSMLDDLRFCWCSAGLSKDPFEQVPDHLHLGRESSRALGQKWRKTEETWEGKKKWPFANWPWFPKSGRQSFMSCGPWSSPWRLAISETAAFASCPLSSFPMTFLHQRTFGQHRMWILPTSRLAFPWSFTCC